MGRYLLKLATIICVAVVTLCFAGGVVPAGAEVTKTALVTTVGGLNVRSGPGTDHAVLTNVADGLRFPVCDTSGDWVKIRLASGQEGWVAGWFVQLENTPPPVVLPSDGEEIDVPPGTTVEVKADGLDIMSSPGGSVLIAYATTGIKLPLVGKAGPWYKIELPTGAPGWVPESGVSVVRKETSRGPDAVRPGGSRQARGGVDGQVIVLDPGHGGGDSGAVGPTGFKEKDFNLPVALETASLLRAEGADVILTRTTDIRLGATEAEDCKERVRIANEAQADLFVSIHANANLSESRDGTSVYYHAHPENHADCIDLAYALQAGLVNALQRRDLGIIGSNLLVLRGIDMPGALVEVAFVSNYEEEALLRQPAFQKQAAEGITAGIKTYFKS